jgi:diguanylate cyclase (GGDEF)-like protein
VWRTAPTTATVERSSRLRTALLCALLVTVIGALDYLSGYVIGFAIFYLIPVGVATWWVGRRYGIVVAIVCTLAWWAADRATAPAPLPVLVVTWNAVMRFGIFVIVNQILASLRRALSVQEEMARVDHVTGVANSRGFFESARRELERARRSGHPLTIVFVDLDDFGSVNNTLGHVAGNRLLGAWAEAVRGELRPFDLVARLGGDEFAILLPETPEAVARDIVQRLRSRLSQTAREKGWPFTCSMGAATFTTPPVSLDVLVATADQLMYAAKAAGKDTWRYEVRRAPGG